MKHSFLRSGKVADYLIAIVLVLVPFQAFLTVFGSSLVGHYTALRLWDDAVLALLLCLVGYWLVRDKALRSWFARSLLVRIICAYAGLTVLLGIISYLKGEVSLKALAYGLLVNLRFLGWFLAVLVRLQRPSFLTRRWLRLLLIPAAIVVLFGALQYTVLPHDFLGHFGYDAKTNIAPIETINHNSHYIRVQSTLRGANPLGAYLVTVVAALGLLFIRGRRRWIAAVFGLVALLTLYASGSRSAWIGTLLGFCVVVWYSLRTRRSRRIFGIAGLAVLVLAACAAVLLRNNVSLENALLHTQKHSAVSTGSNSAHASALRSGLNDVVRQPFGDGPGTAGPASVYNTGHPARIAEDYYVQVAQETGWLGLALFLSALGLVALELYRRIGTSRLALIVFAGFTGIAFVNLLSHAWADDTLAYAWWGFAGIALGAQAGKGSPATDA